MCRGKRSGFRPPDTASFEEMCSTADDKIFRTNEGHTQHEQLPPTTLASQNYSLRARANNVNRQLPKHFGHLSDCNFITRVLYKDIFFIYTTVYEALFYHYMLELNRVLPISK
jgi:hypothetical protein